MKVKYHTIVSADCTSDPHYVHYDDGDEELKARLTVMFQDIIDVCESDMIEGIRVVRGTIGEDEYASDRYDKHPPYDKKNKKPCKTPESKDHRVYGWFHRGDPDFYEEETKHHNLLPGLTGLKQLLKLALERPKEFTGLSVGVVWTFAGDSSCSDYIQMGIHLEGDNGEMNVINYGSQDYWINHEGYHPWCDRMAEMLGRDFPRANDGD